MLSTLPQRVGLIPAWVVAVLLVEVVLAATFRLKRVMEPAAASGPSFDRVLELVGLFFVPVLVLTWFTLLRTVTAARRDAAHERGRVDAVLGMSSEWIWEIDVDGTIIDTNSAVRDILGYEPDQLVGTSSWRLMHFESRFSLVAALEEAARIGRGWTRRRSVWLHSDGTRRYLESSATPVFGADGAVVGFRGASRDATLDEETQRATAAADQRRQERFDRIHGVLQDPKQLSIAYQPIVRIADGRACGVEALSRFGGEFARTPDVWFAEAHDVGLGPAFEVLAIRRAMEIVGELSSNLYLSVNLSAATLAGDEVLRLLLEPGVSGDRLVVELTEHDVVGDYDDLAAQLVKLRRLGVRLAIDDAGAGYSTLHHILRLRPDFIKLDRALISSIDQDPVRRALTAAMVTFANDINAALVAEGVERPEELETLKEIGVPYAQGFLLGRPGPAAEHLGSGMVRPAGAVDA